jgi:hypothetical protein
LKEKDNSAQFILCPKCGSTDYLENYPTQGNSTCTKCGHQATPLMLKVIQEELEGIPSACSSCGKEDENSSPFFSSRDKVVYKCKACGKLDGYLLLPVVFNYEDGIDDNRFDGKSLRQAKTEGKLVYPNHSNKKKLTPTNYVKDQIDEKKEILSKMGVDFETINFAIEKAINHLTHKQLYTDKQLEHIFPAALILVQNSLSGLGKLKGSKLNERQLEEIFKTNRKTTRKWKEILDKE